MAAAITEANPAGHSAEYLNFLAVCEEMQQAYLIVKDAERIRRVREAYLGLSAVPDRYRPNILGTPSYTAPCRLCYCRTTVTLDEYLADAAGVGYYHGHCIEAQQNRLEAERFERDEVTY